MQTSNWLWTPKAAGEATMEARKLANMTELPWEMHKRSQCCSQQKFPITKPNTTTDTTNLITKLNYSSSWGSKERTDISYGKKNLGWRFVSPHLKTLLSEAIRWYSCVAYLGRSRGNATSSAASLSLDYHNFLIFGRWSQAATEFSMVRSMGCFILQFSR